MNQIAELLPAGEHRARPRCRDRRRGCSKRSARCSSATPASRARRSSSSLSAREKLGSTGLGQGIAIPHGRHQGAERGARRVRAPAHADRRSTRPTASRCRRCSSCSCPSRRPTGICSCSPSSRRCSRSARFRESSPRARRESSAICVKLFREWEPCGVTRRACPTCVTRSRVALGRPGARGIANRTTLQAQA